MACFMCSYSCVPNFLYDFDGLECQPLCMSCCNATEKLISLTNELVHDKNCHCTVKEGLEHALKIILDLKSFNVCQLKDRSRFLIDFAGAFTDQVHTDILVKPGDNEAAIPAHKAILATRSNIFRNLLDSDGCKAPENDSITLPDLNGEELQVFLKFLYSGQLAEEELKRHVLPLLHAAHKYEISFLENLCEREILKSLNVDNVLGALEISGTYSMQNLTVAAVDFIVNNNVKDIVLSPEFDAFALKNPHLSLQVTRALVMRP